MGDAWFKPKTYGYGAAPVSWQGWAATLAFVAATWGATWFMLVAPLQARTELTQTDWAIWAALLVALVVGFIVLARYKSDRGWGWRWGDKP